MTGCEDAKPTGQVVATVNGEDVTIGEVRAEAASESRLGGEAATTPELIRAVIARKLWAQDALNAKRDQDVQYILARRRSDEIQLADLQMQALRSTVSGPSAAEIDAFIRTHPQAATSQTVFLVDQVNARSDGDTSVETYFKQERSLGEIQASLTRGGVTAQRSRTEWNSNFMPASVALRLSRLTPTETFIQRHGGVLIAANVISKTSMRLNYAERQTLIKQILTQKELDRVLDARLQELRRAADIRFQPSYAVALP